VLTVASDLLDGYEFAGDQYALASGGKQMFGVISYRDPAGEDLQLALGIRNSYDRSMSAGLVLGCSVFVCDNLMFHGDVKVMRKHTGDNMHQELNDQIVAAIYKSQHQFTELGADAEAMKATSMEPRAGYRYLGILTGEDVLRPTQSTAAYREAKDPSHEEFEEPTLWRYYNAATEALKSSAPQEMVQRHNRLHELTRNLYLN
jgi:hypothetical protein